jgi:hypothetical protein
MNYLSNAVHSGVDNTGTSLRLLVNRLVSDSLAPTVHNKSCIVNEVPADIRMIADEDKVMPVISELLTSVVANARNGNIHISAERFRDVVILEIQERNNYNGYALAYRIQSIEPQATMLGGYIRMKGQQELITTISFSFPNHAAVTSYDC